MKQQEKMPSAQRQNLILTKLKEANQPISGSEFAKLTNVSRQVIVQDVSILKAKNEPIIATSQGYMYLKNEQEDHQKKKVIACKHNASQTKEELYLIVDHGVTIKDVIVEHAVYGDLTASIRVSTRKEVNQFIEKINAADASYLSALTNGIHLHTLEADSLAKIEAACDDLKKAGILI
ncbi:transcription repressor NadR [Oceanobacillus piezotolerans]|uniref:Transcription repressor NadR n=1 Tax=Oceanobacillus piezotolerans TaxID=2448030 RepID=A0A498D9C2_9BACI|nr:transcription repressor NadR [Oceanobacillus piezotolerans]RLL47013.1 transcription repressor NadR [Oceanobacillus piezotolerans]